LNVRALNDNRAWRKTSSLGRPSLELGWRETFVNGNKNVHILTTRLVTRVSAGGSKCRNHATGMCRNRCLEDHLAPVPIIVAETSSRYVSRSSILCFTICFTICLFISPDLDGYRAPKNRALTLRDPENCKVSKPEYEATALCSHRSVGYPNSTNGQYTPHYGTPFR
jgi:hypothetical protein